MPRQWKLLAKSTSLTGVLLVFNKTELMAFRRYHLGLVFFGVPLSHSKQCSQPCDIFAALRWHIAVVPGKAVKTLVRPLTWTHFRPNPTLHPVRVDLRNAYGFETGVAELMASSARRSATAGEGIEMLAMRLPMGALRLAAVAALTLSLGACAAKQELAPDASLNGAGGKYGSATPGSQRDFTQNVGDIVYFSTDQTDLTPEGQQIVQKQAQWLQQYPQYTITIEGHADERGTREYNIALGARRATSVRNYLSQNGVSASRIRTISYGKERPVAVCNDISCWSQNRRAQTVLNSGGQISQR
jgi:peptidoglycan-associated lipoprotein